MNLKDKILKAVKEGLNTAFSFDDITDALLDDIKTEPTKNSAKSVKYRWMYPKLVQLVSEVLHKQELTLKLDEQYDLFEDCINNGISYLFTNTETFINFICRYTSEYTDANLNWIDTSNITDMSYLFYNSEFDGVISQWDVSSVTNMNSMFFNSSFDGDISEWDVSNVTNMADMFCDSVFNGDISQWDVSKVTTMPHMFFNSNFNGDISKWDVSKVIDMYGMFDRAAFNGDISEWNVSNVENMSCMFQFSVFNQDISHWDMSKVTNDCDMFWRCPILNKNRPKTANVNN